MGLRRGLTLHQDTHRRVTQRFSYDDEHRISRVEIDGDAEFTKAEYCYDAPGRRTEKQVWRRHARKPERTQYAWSGLQMVGETSDSHPDAAVQYIYTENSYEPLARVDNHGEHADIFWYHTELNGLPDSVTDSKATPSGAPLPPRGAAACGKAHRSHGTPRRTCASRASTWTVKRACTTTPSATTTPRAGVTRRWIRLVWRAG